MLKNTVVIADDHKLIREMWISMISLYKQFEIINDTGDGDEAVEIVRLQKPNILLLDINMMPVNGFEILRRVHLISPETRVIGVSMHNQVTCAKKMMQEGAKGYVTKTSKLNELIKAMEEVSIGKTYVCQEIKDRMVEESFNNSDEPDIQLLTAREKEIMKFMSSGLTTRLIAERVNIASKTVEVHRYNILKKLHIHNSIELIEYTNTHCL